MANQTHPQLNCCPDNTKRVSQEWIHIRTTVSGHGSLELVSQATPFNLRTRERGYGNFAYIELYTLQDPGVTNQIAAFERYHSAITAHCY